MCLLLQSNLRADKEITNTQKDQSAQTDLMLANTFFETFEQKKNKNSKKIKCIANLSQLGNAVFLNYYFRKQINNKLKTIS